MRFTILPAGHRTPDELFAIGQGIEPEMLAQLSAEVRPMFDAAFDRVRRS